MCIMCMGAVSSAAAQTFSSGSNGSDGALTYPANSGELLFEPQTLGVDADGDGIFHFTTITVPSGTYLSLRADTPGLAEAKPVIWLATGAVSIGGYIKLDGDNGSFIPSSAVPGAGGFAGGACGTPQSDPRGGSGPGGGGAAAGLAGGNAGHLEDGSPTGASPGVKYGNAFLLPLVGGSGGGGGTGSVSDNGGGGGGGGGALLIASSVSISIDGVIQALGGSGPGNGWHGSGGAIKIMAPTVSGFGYVTVGGSGSPGRLRLEAFTYSSNLTFFPTRSLTVGSPQFVLPPANSPTVRVTQVDGVNVPASPTGSFAVPDAIITAASPVSISIAATNIPVGTVVNLRIISEAGSSLTVQSSALAGTLESSTATVGPMTIPMGFSRFYVTATW
jgi:hypothetical protein